MADPRVTLRVLVHTPLEKIVRRDHIATAFNYERMARQRKFLVDLACGHKAYTAAIKRARCPRCTEMLRRSLIDGRENYAAFRDGEVRDGMVWHADPCRQFNEKTDLAGRFADD